MARVRVRDLVAISVCLFLVVCVGSMRIGTPKSYAYRASLESDLRSLNKAQAAHRNRTGRFARERKELVGYTTSTGVTVNITMASDSSYSAFGTHDAVPE